MPFERILFSVLFLAGLPIFGAQEDSLKKTNPMHDDAYLHPVDVVTPYTLKKGEWIYAQSIQTLPFPSWAFVGLTDKLTPQIDLLPWIFGSFTELKKPIPSFNLRYRFNQQKGAMPTFGIETMFVHFWDTLERFTTPTISVWERGSYIHVKPSIGYSIREKLFINLSIGADYIGMLKMENNDSMHFESKSFTDQWNPNYSMGLDFRPSPWISYHVGYSYGSTLTYLENVPRKIQVTYGFRVAPLYKNKFGVLRNMRIELVAINGFFPDVKAEQLFPLPIFPYFYWQWKREKRVKQ